jgi:hypothetical protein
MADEPKTIGQCQSGDFVLLHCWVRVSRVGEQGIGGRDAVRLPDGSFAVDESSSAWWPYDPETPIHGRVQGKLHRDEGETEEGKR